MKDVLNPQRLRVLQAVVAAGSIQAAARNLHYSPATISQHLSALARETDLVLFERDGRGIRPTSAAQHLAEHAAEALAGLDRLARLAEDLRHGRSTHLSIACFSSASQQWLPDAITAARRVERELTVEVSLNEPHAAPGPRPADIDIRNEVPEEVETHLEGYTREVLMLEELHAVLPADHDLAGQGSVSMSQLSQEMWVDHDIHDSPTGRIIRSACQAAGYSPVFSARLDDHHAALSLIRAGLGITVLPPLALLDMPEGLVVRQLSDPTPVRRIVAHVRTSQASSPVVVAALSSLQHQATTTPPS